MHLVDNGNICNDVSLVLRYAPRVTTITPSRSLTSQPSNSSFCFHQRPTSSLRVLQWLKKVLILALPSCLSRQELPALFPSPLMERHHPPIPQLLSTQQQPLDISSMSTLTVRSQVPHRHGAPHFDGHDWLLQNAYATARTQTA